MICSPVLTVLVGLPCSGKSTFVEHIETDNVFVYSTDNYIEAIANESGKTYDDVFSENIDSATKEMNERLKVALENNLDIIWDQTNLGVKKRRAILSKVSPFYVRNCVFWELPSTTEQWSEYSHRLVSRSGKTIPENIITSMIKSFKEPTHDEGFDSIMRLDLYGNVAYSDEELLGLLAGRTEIRS